MDKKKIIIFILVIVLLISLIILSINLINKSQEKKEIKLVNSYYSLNEDYEVKAFQIGVPDFPFGDVNFGADLLYKKEKIAEVRSTLRNDGKDLGEENFEINFKDEYVEIIFKAEEDLYQVYHVNYDGKVKEIVEEE